MAAVSSSLQMNETRRFLSCLVSSLRKHTNSLERERKKKKKKKHFNDEEKHNLVLKI